MACKHKTLNQSDHDESLYICDNTVCGEEFLLGPPDQ